MGGGKSGGGSNAGAGTTTTTQTTTIPPEVLARYNAVNARAEQVANQPFVPYTGEFVAPVNATQQGAIGNITNAQGTWQPAFNTGTAAVTGGLAAAQPLFQQAGEQIGQGLAAGAPLGSQGSGILSSAYGQASPYNPLAAGIIGNAYQTAQPLVGTATGLAAQGTQAVNPTALDANAIGQYMSPFNQAVIASTMANLRQQQEQEQQNLTSNAITGGWYGGDRYGVGAANLARQQGLASGQVLSGLENQNYMQALQAAQQQQGLGLAAAQANRAALQQGANQFMGIGQGGLGLGLSAGQGLLGVGQQIANQGLGLGQGLISGAQGLQGLGFQGAQALQGLAAGQVGTGAQGATALAGLASGQLQNTLGQAQAQLGAGTVPQQTQQALDQALYNQFLQQQGYPFQVTQFLANIAEGTGALSGSTTNSTMTQPQPFFSDERLKENMRLIGWTHDHQPIFAFNFRGNPHTQIGLSAQEVEKKHPEAVGLAAGYKTVDYDAALKDARQKFAEGGTPTLYDPNMIAQMLMAHQAMYPGQAFNPNGIGTSTGPRGMQLAQVQPRMLQTPPLQQPGPLPEPELMQDVKALNAMGQAGRGLGALYDTGKDALMGSRATTDAKGNAVPASGGLVGSGGSFDYGRSWLGRQLNAVPTLPDGTPITDAMPPAARGGRIGRAGGGSMPYGSSLYGVDDVSQDDQSPQALEREFEGMQPRDRGLASARRSMDGGDSSLLSSIAGLPGTVSGLLSGGKWLAGQLGSSAIPAIATDAGTWGAEAAATAGADTALMDALPALAFLRKGGRTGLDAGGTPDEPDDDVMRQTQKRTSLPLPPQSYEGDFDASGRYVDIAPTGVAAGPSVPSPATPQPAPTAVPITSPATPQPPVSSLRSNSYDPATFPSYVFGAETDGRNFENPKFPIAAGGPDGPGQFTRRTWQGFVQANPKIFDGMTSEQIDQARRDPRIAATATNWLAGQNGPLLERNGIPLTKQNLYLAHGAGGAGAVQLLRNPGMNAVDALTPAYAGEKDPRAAALRHVLDNGGDPRMTARQFVQTYYDRADGRKGTPFAPQDQSPQIPPSSGTGLASGPAPNRDFLDRAGDWVDRNERPLMAGLTFLGNMLGSPSRYLAGAIGHGLAAAAPFYYQSGLKERELGQRGQQVEQQGQQVELSRSQKLIELYNQYRQIEAGQAQVPGYKPTSFVDFLRSVGQESLMHPVQSAVAQARGVLQAPSGSPPVTRQGTPGTPTPPTSPTAPPSPQEGMPGPQDPFWKQVAPQDNVYELDRRINEAYRFGNIGLAEQLTAQRAAILSRKTVQTTDGRIVPIPGAFETQAQGEATQLSAQARVKTNIDTRTQAFEEARSGQQALSQASAMLDAMFDRNGQPKISSGPLGERLAHAGALLKQAGFSDGFIQSFLGTNPSDVQEMEKLRTAFAAELARQNIDQVRQQEYLRFITATPGVSMLPQAFKKIIEETIIPRARAQIGAYDRIKGLDAGAADSNFQGELLKYGQENPWYKWAPAASREGGPAATRVEAAPPIDERKVGTTYVAPDGKNRPWLRGADGREGWGAPVQ